MVIGGVDDQIAILVWERLSVSTQQWLIQNPFYAHTFSALINPLSTNEPLTYVLLKLFLDLFHSHAYNLFLLFTLAANLLVGYAFFKKYKYATFLTALYAFSAFFWLHIGKHVSLAELWVLPLCFMFLQRLNHTWRSYISLGVVLGITVLISNYLGFCLLVFAGIYLVSGLITRQMRLREVMGFVISFIFAAVIVFISLFPYISANYFNKIPSQADSSILVLRRTIDDFLLFSARPWYFFIPPVKSVLYGSIPTQIYEKIAKTGYFLADDYFDGEHGSLFLGYSLMLLTGYLLLYAYKQGDSSMRSHLSHNLLSIVLIISFMMPPFFTISGLTVYTPGWLIYKFFPMFRVTSRFIVVILFILLTLIGEILTKYPFKGKKSTLIYLLLPLILLETYIPLKFTRVEAVPEEISQLSSYISKEDMFATYPYSSTKQVFYYLPDYERLLLNPRGLAYGDFSSESFTSELVTDAGLIKAHELGVKYLLVYKDIPQEDLYFFGNSKYISKSAEFSKAYLFKFNN